MSKWGIGLIVIALLITAFPNPSYATGFSTEGYPAIGPDVSLTPQGPAAMQTFKAKVKGKSTPKPKIIWVQSDTEIWTAGFGDGTSVSTGTNFSGDHAVPLKKFTSFTLDMGTYAPDTMKDSKGNGFPRTEIKDISITAMGWGIGNGYDSPDQKPTLQPGTLTANINVNTGYPLPFDDFRIYATRYDGANKFMREYYIPMLVDYEGYVIEKKQMRVLQNTTLQVNDTKYMTAQVRTMNTDMSNFDNNWVDVSTSSDTIWSSDNGAVATVNASGNVTAHAQGTAKITAMWKKGPYWLYGSATVTVGGTSQGDVLCTTPVPGRTVSGQYMDPGVAAEIRADQRGNEPFDVLQGIPSSESLYGQVSSRDYLFQNTFVEMSGTCTYDIKINKNWTLTWTPPREAAEPGEEAPEPSPESDEEDKTYEYTIVRPYSYWTIDNLEIYELKQAVLSNDALPGGTITLVPSGYTAPNFSTEITGKYIAPVAPAAITATAGSKDGGTTRPTPDDDTEVLRPLAEEAAKKIEVQNDTLIFGGQTLMNGSVVTEMGPAPGTIPAPQPIGDNVLYKPGNIIVPTHPNARNIPSSGEIQYGLMDGSINAGPSEQTFPIAGINSVTVHTPVVNYSVLPDDNRPFDQRMVPDLTRTVLILDRPFTVHFTESGQHLNMPGYGNRDYAKYTKNKRIQFPFGVFQGSEYYPENTWIYIPVGTPSMTFTMPTWVHEGDYTIHTQSWAINAPSDGTDLCEVNLNGNLTNYCASESFNVGVVGRLFDFRIWDIGDFRFEKVFRTAIGTTNHSSAMYYTGGNDENGSPTALYGQKQWFLPIRKGSHPTEQKTVPHNGYSFLFDFRTIGNLWEKGEGIRIEPTFWFVPRTGGSPTPVDLYYDISGTANKMIGVGSPKDKLSYKRTYRLADGLRNISSGELSTAASYEYNYILSDTERDETAWAKFYKQYLKRKTTLATGYGIEILPFKSRTLIGPTAIPDSVNPITAVRSVQHWYGEYHLPIAPYILPKGTNIVSLANHYGGVLDGHEPEFRKGGYILINFGIYTVKNGDVNTRILGYKAPIANMWAIEGQMTGDTDELGQTFSFSSGDIILFESDFSVRNDFQGQGR